MKKMILSLCACLIATAFTLMPAYAAEGIIDTDNMTEHKIGVLVYSSTAEEVVMFRDYLKGYIEECFPDVEFIYSYSVTTPEEELDFIQNAADSGAEGILSFNSFDLKAEVELCEKNQIYYMIASGTVDEDSFHQVEQIPAFVGVIGPGAEMEYQAGADMAAFFAEQKFGDAYLILSGGASMSNEMHKQRTIGILDTLQKQYGVTFDQSSEELALSGEITHAQADDLQVCICPGYLDFEVFADPIKEEYEKDQFPSVLSVLPVSTLFDTIRQAKIGAIDCYSDANRQMFEDDSMVYVTGKYGSIIGPSFAAMYNAVTGHADKLWDNGKAIKLKQGFWTSGNKEDFMDKYSLATSLSMIAYNAEDLMNVCYLYNPEVDPDDLPKLAEAYSYEDALERRNQ